MGEVAVLVLFSILLFFGSASVSLWFLVEAEMVNIDTNLLRYRFLMVVTLMGNVVFYYVAGWAFLVYLFPGRETGGSFNACAVLFGSAISVIGPTLAIHFWRLRNQRMANAGVE